MDNISWLYRYYEQGLLSKYGNADDRLFAGKLLSDCFCRCRFDFGKGIDYGKLRVDTSGGDKTPDYVLVQRDRFRSAMLAVPLSCRKTVEDVVCWNLSLKRQGNNERHKRENFIAALQTLCIGLDCLAAHYKKCIKKFK